MKYFLFILIVACKIQPFSSTRQGNPIRVDTNVYQDEDFYLELKSGVLLATKKGTAMPMTLRIQEMQLRQPQTSYTTSDSEEQLLDSIDYVIMDGAKGKPRLLFFDKLSFTIIPDPEKPDRNRPYEYNCTFTDVALGKIRFQLNTTNCSSNHTRISNEALIAQNCSHYNAVKDTAVVEQLAYQSETVNGGAVFTTGDVYLYQRTGENNCKQTLIFDAAAVDFMKRNVLTCDNEWKFYTPIMTASNTQLLYACGTIDVVFFSGQSDSTLKVVSKPAFEQKDEDDTTYFAGAVATLYENGKIEHEAIHITKAGAAAGQ